MKMFGRGKDCGVFVSGENINFIKVTRTIAQCTYNQKAVDLDLDSANNLGLSAKAENAETIRFILFVKPTLQFLATPPPLPPPTPFS